MNQYKYTEKKIIDGGREYKAIFPEKHSTVKGLVIEWTDANGHDGYATFPRWQRIFHVLWHSRKTWDYIRSEDERYKWIVPSLGFLAVLEGLENTELKKVLQ